MSDLQNTFGMIGLGVMGRNLLLNMADHGFSVSGLDKNPLAISFLEKEDASKKVFATGSTEEFVSSLAKPRSIMMLVPAGSPVDLVLEELMPYLEKGDIVIDGGNSYFKDTIRRTEEMKGKGIHFLGIGVSGGEQGARTGPSMMPGGDKEAYKIIKPVLEAIAAKVNNEPCVSWLGNGGAGHYVKMVHNGIEYAIMQLISEAYDLMKRGMNLSNDEIHKAFKKWNQGKLQSFLIEITANIFLQKDDKKPGLLVDNILDLARQKGTGKWTTQNALDLQVPLSVIDLSVTMRILSAYKKERIQASEIFPYKRDKLDISDEQFLALLEDALYFSVIIAYAQGMALLQRASLEYDFGLDMKEIAKIWRGGCIIRASLLEDLRKAYAKDPLLTNLLLDQNISEFVKNTQVSAREIIKRAVSTGVPLTGFMASLAYFDAYRSKNLPLNLIQAQRDYFGAHTYERIDEEGIFHTQWEH